MGGLFRRGYRVDMCIQNCSREAKDKTTLFTYDLIQY